MGLREGYIPNPVTARTSNCTSWMKTSNEEGVRAAEEGKQMGSTYSEREDDSQDTMHGTVVETENDITPLL
jgi:hypothetical protein